MTDKTSSTKKNVSGKKSNAPDQSGKQGVQSSSGSTPPAAFRQVHSFPSEQFIIRRGIY
ncbi:MAG TPA: hypothetical protein VJZ78_03910 [Anaerolineales bacterium]|nr:hypothetical protein [Anaerolineales bacterium]